MMSMANGVTEMTDSHLLEVRPHGAHNRLGALPADTMSAAFNLHRIFGGVVIDPRTGIDYTPAPVTE